MISENLHKIQQEIQDSCALVSRKASEVRLVAVTKSVDSEKHGRSSKPVSLTVRKTE
ncbi:Hypothetical protein YggS [Enterococcus sp. HSIEG1]|nr:Hypothetical protein YggS [Enterococcus sp. HSIEG1]